MLELILAVLVFLASHAIPAVKPVRAALTARLGERAYLILYSLISLAVLVWLGGAYARAPYVEVWPFAMWTRWVPVLVMPMACILLVAAVSSANPFSIEIGRRPFDPERPGIVSVTRHPLIWAFILWAGAHLVPNGDAASILLFGLLLVLSLLGPMSLDAKRKAQWGAGEWARRTAATSNVPLAAVATGHGRLDLKGIGFWRLVAGLACYVALWLGHEWLIGVSPAPL